MANDNTQLSPERFNEIIGHPKVREALRLKAQRVQAAAEQIAQGEGVKEFKTELTEGTRPKGRPFARVSSSDVDQEYGTSVVGRKRILGRAAESA